ncbi:MAG: T9SS type A sorting domain-containing protein [bacterium]|nr:T9SS type A sorting domain-containing protein [bacterium]
MKAGKLSVIALAIVLMLVGLSQAQDSLNVKKIENADPDTTTLIINWTGLEDTYLSHATGYFDYNFGGHNGAISAKKPYETYLIRINNLDSLIGENKLITSCKLNVYINTSDTLSPNKTVGIYRVFKPWVSGILDVEDPGEGEGCTFNQWSADTYFWGVAGCHAESDSGYDNQGNGSGADCKQTPESIALVDQTWSYPWVTPGYRTWSISNDLANGWYNGSYRNNGVAAKVMAPGGWVHILTAEYEDLSRRPWFEIQYVDSPPQNVQLTPHNPPIQIPANGGNFFFDVSIVNSDTNSCTIDAWIDITLPSQIEYPITNRTAIILSGGGAVTRLNLQQVIPPTASQGYYNYNLHIRDHYSWEVYDNDSFQFVKLPGASLSNGDESWSLYGWFDGSGSKEIINAFSSFSPSPNPFNPTTNLTFTLPHPAKVSLQVFDISGRTVGVQHVEPLPAGAHTIPFDGSGLPSGIYFARLMAGEYSSVQKLVLLK